MSRTQPFAPSFLALAPALAAFAASGSAQSLNVDIGQNVLFPAPASSYAAAGSAGAWNPVAAPASAIALVGLDGAPTSATITSSGGFLNFDYDNFGTTGEAQNLLDDVHDLGGPTSIVTWSFAGLVDDDYTVYTYAWAPDNTTFRTRVAIVGSPDPEQDVGGAWGGSHQLGLTYARHRVTVTGGTLAIGLTTISGFGSLNGFQLVRGSFVSYPTLCAGDGSGTACPCGNSGGAGRGCANSIDPTGAVLVATGVASVAGDTLVLSGTGMPNSSALYFQGSSALGGGAGTVFGDGLRCAGGAVVRLATKTNVTGMSQYPGAGDASVSVRGGVAAGDQRVYQVWYRNAAAFCTVSTFNVTNGVSVTWGA